VQPDPAPIKVREIQPRAGPHWSMALGRWDGQGWPLGTVWWWLPWGQVTDGLLVPLRAAGGHAGAQRETSRSGFTARDSGPGTARPLLLSWKVASLSQLLRSALNEGTSGSQCSQCNQCGFPP